MASAGAARSAFRSFTSIRTTASRISSAAAPKPNATSSARSAFRIPSQKPLSHRIFRSPVEMSCVSVESMHPFHTATASALLTSMLSAASRTCGWSIEGKVEMNIVATAAIKSKARVVVAPERLWLLPMHTNVKTKDLNDDV